MQAQLSAAAAAHASGMASKSGAYAFALPLLYPPVSLGSLVSLIGSAWNNAI